VDPITVALLEYQEYLKNGGQPVSMETFYTGHKHEPAWKIYPSGLLLCDRKIAYGLMEEHGLIDQDFPMEPLEALSHLPGFIIQEAIGKALHWKGALVAYEFPVQSDHYKGRGDLLVDPTKLGADTSLGDLWAIDVKANKGYVLGRRYPSKHNIAQAEQIAHLYRLQEDRVAAPMLYYTLRVDMSTNALYTWSWNGSDCETYQITDSRATVLEIERTFPSLLEEIYGCQTALESWLGDVWQGQEPVPEKLERCGLTPYDHPFMCANYSRYDKSYKVNCPFFSRCWQVSLKPFFVKDDWDEVEEGWVEREKEIEYEGL